MGCFLHSNLKLFIASSIVSHFNFFDNLFSDICVLTVSSLCLFFVVFHLPVIPVSGPYDIVIFVSVGLVSALPLIPVLSLYYILIFVSFVLVFPLLLMHVYAVYHMFDLWALSSGVSDCCILFLYDA